MVNDSYFRFDDDNKIKYTFSQSWQANWVSWGHTAPYIERKIIARIVSILDTHLAAYTWQAFYLFNAFGWVCIMMILRCCNLQTNEHDLQAIMYPIVCKYHRLNINRLNTNNWNKVPVFPRYICNRWQNMVVQTPLVAYTFRDIWYLIWLRNLCEKVCHISWYNRDDA